MKNSRVLTWLRQFASGGQGPQLMSCWTQKVDPSFILIKLKILNNNNKKPSTYMALAVRELRPGTAIDVVLLDSIRDSVL
jgi:hypothetical protein